MILWGILAGLLFCLETIYHLYSFGMQPWDLWFTVALIVTWSVAVTLLVGILRGRWKKVVLYGFVWLTIIWDGFQLGYMHIFKQPLLWEAIFRGGKDALTNYWKEALTAFVQVLPFTLLMVAMGIGIVLFVEKWHGEVLELDSLQFLRLLVVLTAGLAGSIAIMEVGKEVEADYYEDYHDFFDPLMIAEKMGILPMFQRDTVLSVENAGSSLVKKIGGSQKKDAQVASVTNVVKEDPKAQDEIAETAEQAGNVPDTEQRPEEAQGEEPAQTPEDVQGEELVPTPHSLPIDFQALRENAANKHQTWLVDYIEGMSPTMSNEYTGMFRGYNLIYLTAEGFSPYAVREDLTPTLYRLVHSGFVFNNYYVPLWQTSTSDGEYVNCTGLIPDGQFSFRKSSENDMAFSLPRYFAREGVESLAYHDNTLTYYDRNLSHPNLGYFFKAAKYGDVPASEWEGHIFPMENPGRWPASDLEMMQGTMPDYIGADRFHAYYMTVSGHMNYNFRGNAMSSKNREAVAHLEMSENARAYIACNIELDKALEYMLQELEASGQLERTVICLSADHYPYAMTKEQYEELAGRDLSSGKDLMRNNLILWNVGMEEPVVIDKACCAMDIMPTLLNLFGFAYDSRMYAGRDILSDEPGLVIFNDRSFVTDLCVYDRKKKELTWTEAGSLLSPEEQEAYLEKVRQDVKDRYQFSAYILQENFYKNVREALPEW